MTTSFLPKPAKYNFTLDIDVGKVEKNYKLKPSEVHQPLIVPSKGDISVSYIDSTRRNRKCVITMKNYMTQKDVPLKYKGRCCNDHHTFNSQAIGCPISYISSVATIKYYSDITGSHVIIKRDLTKQESREYTSSGKLPEALSKLPTKDEMKDYEKKIEINDYYLVDKFFCSIECVRRYIHDNRLNVLYRSSLSLLFELAEDYFGVRPDRINMASDHCLLVEYGGHLTIEDYRHNFNTVEYVDRNDTVKKLPVIFPVGHTFEEIIKF